MTANNFMPHDYQADAIRWIEERRRCCLFLEMGLGKTVVTLTAIQHLLDRCEVSRVLIVAPKKVADSTWQAEASKWAHLGLSLTYIAGTPSQRLQSLEEATDVHVIGRDSLAWLRDVTAGELQRGKVRYDMIVLDELTSFKNRSSSRWRAARELCAGAEYVVGLTGTPTPQGLIDLWAQIYLIDFGKRLGPTLTGYRAKWFNVVEHNHIAIKTWPKEGAEKEINARLSDLCLTMLSADHNPLPALHTRDVRVELSAGIMEGYRKFERDRVMEVGDTSAITAASAASLLNKLQQYTGGAVYLDEEPSATGQRPYRDIHRAKLEALNALTGEEPTMVFYQYKHEAARIYLEMKRRGLRVRKYRSAEDLTAWNAGEVDVLLAHPASTAYGLNLQYGGRRMVWYSTGWNLELYEQAVARLHRQGQRREVECYRLVCPGTVDEAVTVALRRKSKGQRALMEALSAVVANVESGG